MSFFSKSSGKRHHENKYHGSNYYKREGLLNRILRMFGSLSYSDKKYHNHHSHNSHPNHYSDQRYKRRRYKSSWS